MRLALIAALALGCAPPLAAGEIAAERFAAADGPTLGPARAIGSYARGCLAGAVQLAGQAKTFIAMRPSRDRHWGHPMLVSFLEQLAEAAPQHGLRGLLIGDLSQPRGGPMPYGHVSHQIGLDADVWLQEMPEGGLAQREREETPFVSTLTPDGAALDPARFTPPFHSLIAHAARDERVERIFVHPRIKRALCNWDGAGSGDARDWLRKVRPWYGHDAHFHVRLKCPEGSPACRPQAPPPPGEGCGAPLAYWFTDAPYRPRPDAPQQRPLTLDALPDECRTLLEQSAADQAATPAGQAIPVPPRPQ